MASISSAKPKPKPSSSRFDHRSRLEPDPQKTHEKMASSTAIQDSGLIALALVIRYKDGPRFVHHYPAHPNTRPWTNQSNLFGTELDETDSEEESNIYDDDSDLEDGAAVLGKASNKASLGESSRSGDSKKPDHVEPLKNDTHYDNARGDHIVPWETVVGFSTTDLESILTPAKGFHKKKFQLKMDPLTYISYPIHIRPDGTWKKKKVKKSKKTETEEEPSTVENDSRVSEGKAAAKGSEDEDEHGGMTMFNVVFIMSIPKHEKNERIELIFEHVIKGFHKALHHAQASSDYVWKESEMILAMKEKAKEERRPMSWLWQEILTVSTLAKAMKDLFDAVSKNNIATIHLKSNPPLDLSLQIPIPAFLTRLPTYKESAMPGLLVTSHNPLEPDEGSDGGEVLNKHYALLLLDDEAKTIAEITADGTELSGPLIQCIRVCKPTLSFLQVAQTNSIELKSLLILAQHLIHWRRALAVPPLHGREMYIVNPNCDSRKLPTASVAWKNAFPIAPTLPHFLSVISAAPRPYKSFAPSKDHRPTYIEMLAWLMRGGWVTQLSTFAWILVWPEVLYEVDYQLRGEAIEKAKRKGTSSGSLSASPGSTDESEGDKMPVRDPSKPLTTEEAAENARLGRLAQKAAQEAADEAAAFADLPKPVATDKVSINFAEHLKKIAPYVIKDPHKVSHEESLYIAAVGNRIKDPKAKENWHKFTKYFNGHQPLEMIALREGMKRKETWGLLLQMQEHILVCKHW